jgi:magnesium transporter
MARTKTYSQPGERLPLTVITTIFMPLTFIAGIYGMNFEFMPELKSPWGYPVVIVVMFTIALCMAIYFRRKKWL